MGNLIMINAYYVECVKEYLSMPKDAGFDYMETLVEEISDAEGITWSAAYEFFGLLCDEVVMGRK